MFQNNPEDFFFSQAQLKEKVIAAGKGICLYRTYLNGKEFTDRLPSGRKSDYEDAIVVGERIEGASKHNEAQLVTGTFKAIDPADPLYALYNV